MVFRSILRALRIIIFQTAVHIEESMKYSFLYYTTMVGYAFSTLVIGLLNCIAAKELFYEYAEDVRRVG
jgi:hypothetical protein